MIEGVRLHYYRGGGPGPTIVMSHGVTDFGLSWSAAARRLASRYDIIMWDQRGHGLSDAPPGEVYTGEYRARDLANLLNALGLEQPFLMGHSMGGETTALLAATHPEIPRGIILEDPALFSKNMSEQQRQRRRQESRREIVRRRAASLRELMEESRSRVHPGWPEEEHALWAQAKKRVSPRIATYLGSPRRPWRETVPRIQCPVLLVVGDPAAGRIIVTAEIAADAATLWRKAGVDATVAKIDGAAHNIRRDRPEEFLAVIEPWLARH